MNLKMTKEGGGKGNSSSDGKGDGNGNGNGNDTEVPRANTFEEFRWKSKAAGVT